MALLIIFEDVRISLRNEGCHLWRARMEGGPSQERRVWARTAKGGVPAPQENWYARQAKSWKERILYILSLHSSIKRSEPFLIKNSIKVKVYKKIWVKAMRFRIQKVPWKSASMIVRHSPRSARLHRLWSCICRWYRKVTDFKNTKNVLLLVHTIRSKFI